MSCHPHLPLPLRDQPGHPGPSQECDCLLGQSLRLAAQGALQDGPSSGVQSGLAFVLGPMTSFHQVITRVGRSWATFVGPLVNSCPPLARPPCPCPCPAIQSHHLPHPLLGTRDISHTRHTAILSSAHCWARSLVQALGVGKSLTVCLGGVISISPLQTCHLHPHKTLAMPTVTFLSQAFSCGSSLFLSQPS